MGQLEYSGSEPLFGMIAIHRHYLPKIVTSAWLMPLVALLPDHPVQENWQISFDRRLKLWRI
jgi:hypothetical protein